MNRFRSRKALVVWTSVCALAGSAAMALLVVDPIMVFATVYGTFTEYGITTSSAETDAVGDFDNDSKLDIVFTNNTNSTSPGVSWASNNGTSSTWTVTSIDSTNWKCTEVFVKDVDGDGNLDVTGGRTDAMGNSYACWWRNTSNGSTWTRYDIGQVGSSWGPMVNWVEAGDVDHDGRMDVVFACYNEIGWFRNVSGTAPNFTWTKYSLESTTAQYMSAHPANFDSDAALEIVTTNYYAGAPGMPTHLVCYWDLTSMSPVTFSRTDISTYSTNAVSGATCGWDGDFDGDGNNDIVACGSTTRVFTGNGSGSFTAFSNLGVGATQVRSGVFDSSSPTRSSIVLGGNYYVYNWNGSSWDITTVVSSAGNDSHAGLSLGDIDADGKIDITGAKSTASTAGMLRWWKHP